MTDDVSLDPRLHPYRSDLAAESLRGIVFAPRYAMGEPVQITASHLPLRAAPRADAPLQTEGLFGETLALYESREGWGWVQLDRDRYVGYLPLEGVSRKIVAPTHKISALRTYLYPAPDIKTPPLGQLSLNAQIAVTDEQGPFLALADGGFLYAAHAAPLDATEDDFVAVAERFAGTPYLWGGRTSLGLDCSGLVQLALEAAGIEAPRDTDMQAASLGTPIDAEREPLARGDLVFWPGHVGIMSAPDRLLHANAHHMAVAEEDFVQACRRIAAAGHTVSQIKRMA